MADKSIPKVPEESNALRPKPENIPKVLKELPRWVLWRHEAQRPGEKLRKVPYTVQGVPARPNRPEDGKPFLAVWNVYLGGGYDGVGFILAETDGLVAVDLDGCRDPETGEVVPEARRIVELLRGYTEISPSGAGLRIFVKGDLPRTGIQHRPASYERLELYSAAHYLTITGHVLPDFPTDVPERQGEIDALLRKFGRDIHRCGGELSEDAPPDVEALAKETLKRLPTFVCELWEKGRDFRDRSGEAYNLASLCVENGITDETEIAAVVFTSAAHSDKFSKRADAWIDAIRCAQRALVGVEAEDAPAETSSKDAEPASPPAPTLRIMSGIKFIEQAQANPPKWFWHRLIGTGALTLLCGRMRLAGKSTFLAHLLYALTLGKERRIVVEAEAGQEVEAVIGPAFLGFAVDQQPRRILLCTEEPAYVWTEGRPALDWRRIDVLDDLANLADAHEDFERQVAEGRWELIVVDSLDFLLSLSGITSENEAAEVSRVLGRFLTLARKNNVAVLILDHLRKSDDTGELAAVRGSGAKVGRADVILTLSPTGGGSRQRMLRGWSRFRLPGALAATGLVIELAENGSAYREVGSKATVERMEKTAELRNFVETYIPDNGTVQLVEITKAAGLPKGTVSRRLGEAKELGLVEKVGRGRWQRAGDVPL